MEDDKYKPLPQLRWLQLPISGTAGLEHPSAISPYHQAPVVMVLQQLWAPAYGGRTEWRDIPMVAPESPKDAK